MNKITSFYSTSTGKKYVMAITGIIGFGFVIMHMLGNMQIFLGREAINHYAVLLRSTGGLLWIARGTLLVAVFLHIIAAFQLSKVSLESRPVQYAMYKPVASSYASRTMRVSGPILLVFIIYHLLDFTFGKANPSNFIEGDVYHNVIASFSLWYVSAFYIVGMICLGLHLYHGAWSMFQSLGANNPKYNPILRAFAALSTAVLVIGNISIPVAIYFHLIPNNR